MAGRSAKNIIQNFAIVLLSCSAAVLFFWTYALSGPLDAASLGTLFSAGTAGAVSDSSLSELTELATPVALAVTGKFGRSGTVRLTTTAEEFSAPGSLLQEALGSALTPEDCTEKEFRGALNVNSVYYDFHVTLPLSLIGSLVGTDSAPPASARRLVLSAGKTGTILYYTDGKTYSRCVTGVTQASLTELVNTYQPGNASFAFELEGGSDLAPYSLLITDSQLTFPQLTAESSLSDSSSVLSALGFNPHTQSRYTETGGTDVVMDGDRTLRLETGGLISYDSGGDGAVQISAVDAASPTVEEAVLGASRLMAELLGDRGGSASLALRKATHSGEVWTLLFDYQLDGTPVIQRNTQAAGSVKITGITVTDLSLQLRRYTPTEENSLLLPLTQALAIAGQRAGTELEICYTDGGTGTAAASWLME